MAECSDRSIKNPQPEEEEYTAVVGKHLSMLCLDNSSRFKSPNSSPKPRRTLKRRSPSQSPPIPQPNPKKEKLDFPHNPLLRRCSSERFNPTSPPPPPPPFYSFNSHHNQLQCPNAAAPASASTDTASGVAALSASATLCRSVSDPKPSSCSPALKTISRQSSSSSGDEDDDDDTPNSKRLRRIKDRVREMGLWFQQVMLENEDDDEEEEEVELEPPQEQHHQQNGDTTELQVDCDINFAESVSVERVGDGLVIHFRCHCGVPYQFLLAGGNCYYKLM